MTRAVFLCDTEASHCSPAIAAFARRLDRLDIVEPARRGVFQHLVALQPDLVIAQGLRSRSLTAALYTALSRECRLLLWVIEPPGPVGDVRRLVLWRADGVLASGDGIAAAVGRVGVPTSCIFPLSRLWHVETGPPGMLERLEPSSHRLLHVGALSTETAAVDFARALADWAARNPSRQVEIGWVGEGELLGALAAQPLPPNASQHFYSHLSPPDLATAFAQSGIVVCSGLAPDCDEVVAQALTAGLLILGSQRNAAVAELVREGEGGWKFDPFSRASILCALDRALQLPSERLNAMRRMSQSGIRRLGTRNLQEIDKALTLVTRERGGAVAQIVQ